MSARTTRVVNSTLLAALLILGSCAEGRPSESDWLTHWREAVAIVPDIASIPDDPDPVCERVLTDLRRAAPELLPSPDPSLDGTTRTWLELAESTFFECPPSGSSGFEEAFDQLSRLEAEVEAGLAAP